MPSKQTKSVDGIKAAPKRKTTKKPAAAKNTDGVKVEVRHGKKPASAPKPLAKKKAIKEAETAAAIAEIYNNSEEPAPAEAPVTLPTEENDEIMTEINRLEEADPEMAKTDDIRETPKDKKLGKTPKKRTKIEIILSIIALLAEAGAGAFFIYGLLKLNILQDWQNYCIIVAMAFLFLFTLRKLTKRKARRGTRIFCIVLALLLAGGYAYAYYHINNVVTFIEDITADNTEQIEYSIAVYKDSTIKDIKGLAGKKLGFQSTDLHLEQAKNVLSEELKYTGTDFGDLANMFVGLENKSLDGIVLASSYIDMLKEDSKEYYNKLKIIYTFNIEVEKEKETASDIDIQNQPFILYLSGTDSRGSVRATARSDVNMLIVINPKLGKILIVSVPRDYYVQLHGTTGKKDKLTHAGIYGIDMSKNTMADLFGVSIAHTIKVSFTTVEKLVDAVDGIDIYSDQRIKTWGTPSYYINKGNVHLNGKEALAFARERKSYASGDRHRLQNQQTVFSAIFEKATSLKYIVNYTRLLDAIKDTFQTSLSYDEITNFAKMQLNTMRKWEIESISLDGKGSSQPTYSMGNQKLYVMIPNQKSVDDAKAKIQEYLKTEEAEKK
ncbi:LCP family protein [Candidatus Saccharibacteria bacterium]|nr:LCP family protein [Candidatus Saccharibacteria bacterium]